MAQQSISDEAKMPPRCCTQPIPGSTVKEVLTREGQQAFLKAVVQYGTPWESRIFCPNAECGEFIPPKQKLDPKHPFNVCCRKCSTRVCVMCKRNAHPVGKDCPEDYELEAVLKMGEKSGWRRCYKCRNLVELTQGCTHMTCRCKAQFCYICGGIWDASLGCPNVCNGEEELERRRLEEEERMAELEAEKAAEEAVAAAKTAEKQEAVERSQKHESFQRLAKAQGDELQRFLGFVETAKENMRARHTTQKSTMIEKHQELEEKMRERHTKTANHLEDRQVAAEMELRSTLDQSERSVRIRLKHMEAYCDGLGRAAGAVAMPARQVTERDLRELGQQYNLRDGMERLHQSKINVMRDRQAKRMEELLDRQETELEKLLSKSQEEMEQLAGQFADETEALNNTFVLRKKRLQRRWKLAIQILCKELEKNEGYQYGEIPTPSWPNDGLEDGNDDRTAPAGSMQS